MFEQRFLWMWGLLPLVVSIGSSFMPGWEEFGVEGIVGIWEGTRVELGQGFPCLQAIFPRCNVAG